MIIIKIPIRSERADVKNFLKELIDILNSQDFNIDQNFIFIQSNRDEIEYSNRYTIADLDYDANDVVDRIRELTIQNYSETLIDKDDDMPPLLFVFGKDINGRMVYIKIKIKGKATKKVLCVSFHYAKYEMRFPYA